jgi:hypothetical protein
MEVVPTDEKNVRRAIRTGVSDALRSYYGDLLKETIPSRLTDLLQWVNGRILHPAGRLGSRTLSYCYLMSGAGLAPRCARGACLGNAAGSGLM